MTPAPEADLAACLIALARWRKCSACGRLVLFVNEQARSDGDVECGACQKIRENLASKLRPSLLMRAALHLRALHSTANDNNHAGMSNGS